MKQKHIVYALCHPVTNEIRYIGFTSYPKKRLKDHHCQLKAVSHKNSWIVSLLKEDLRAKMIVLEEHPTAESLPEAEIRLIKYYRSIGADLVNSTDGGESFSFTEEIRKKISEKSKGNKNWLGKTHSEETKRKLSENRKGKYTGQNSSMYGKHHNLDTRLKISKALCGKPHKQGSQNPLFGIPRSQEIKDKISKANSGKKVSEETRRKMSASSVNKKIFSQEQINDIVDSPLSLRVLAKKYECSHILIRNIKIKHSRVA